MIDSTIMDPTRYQFYKRMNAYGFLFFNDINNQINEAYCLIKKALDNGNKLLIFGNGGSAAQAQHFAAELVCKFKEQRKAIPAIALTADTAILTAVSNDLKFDYVFSRQIEALCKEGDVAIGITTSDAVADNPHSRNIRRALIKAGEKKAKRIGLFSKKTKSLLPLVDAPIIVPQEDMELIQEIHLSVIHILCEKIEKGM